MTLSCRFIRYEKYNLTLSCKQRTVNGAPRSAIARGFTNRYAETVKGQGLTDKGWYGIVAAMDKEPINLLGISAADWAKTPESVQLALCSLLDIVQAQSTQIKDLDARVQE